MNWNAGDWTGAPTVGIQITNDISDWQSQHIT